MQLPRTDSPSSMVLLEKWQLSLGGELGSSLRMLSGTLGRGPDSQTTDDPWSRGQVKDAGHR